MDHSTGSRRRMLARLRVPWAPTAGTVTKQLFTQLLEAGSLSWVHRRAHAVECIIIHAHDVRSELLLRVICRWRRCGRRAPERRWRPVMPPVPARRWWAWPAVAEARVTGWRPEVRPMPVRAWRRWSARVAEARVAGGTRIVHPRVVRPRILRPWVMGAGVVGTRVMGTRVPCTWVVSPRILRPWIVSAWVVRARVVAHARVVWRTRVVARHRPVIRHRWHRGRRGRVRWGRQQ